LKISAAILVLPPWGWVGLQPERACVDDDRSGDGARARFEGLIKLLARIHAPFRRDQISG